MEDYLLGMRLTPLAEMTAHCHLGEAGSDQGSDKGLRKSTDLEGGCAPSPRKLPKWSHSLHQPDAMDLRLLGPESCLRPLSGSHPDLIPSPDARPPSW